MIGMKLLKHVGLSIFIFAIFHITNSEQTGTTESLGKLRVHSHSLSGNYLVVMKENLTQQTDSMMGFMATGRGRTKMLSSLGIMSVEGVGEGDLSGMLADPDIEFIEEVIPMHAAGASVTCTERTYNIPSDLWGLDRVDQKNFPLDGRMRITESNPSGDDVLIYVLDTGIYAEHPDFQGRVTKGPSFISDEPTSDDYNGHGTHCAGIAGGFRHGVNKNAKLVAVKVLNRNSDGTTGTVSDGLDYVVTEHRRRGGQGVARSVASLSIGGGRSDALNAAVRRAYIEGAVVVVASANGERDAIDVSPASAPEAITVGASRKDDRRLWYSNFGTLVDIHAPGEDIISTYIPSSKRRRRHATSTRTEQDQRYTQQLNRQKRGADESLALEATCSCAGCDERRLERREKRRNPPPCPGGGSNSTTTNPTTTATTTTTTTTTQEPSAEGPVESMWGTSMATPHVAGAISLFLQRQESPPPPELAEAWLKLHATYTLNVNLPFSDSGTTRAILQVPQC